MAHHDHLNIHICNGNPHANQLVIAIQMLKMSLTPNYRLSVRYYNYSTSKCNPWLIMVQDDVNPQVINSCPQLMV